jgi:hypothetical protein
LSVSLFRAESLDGERVRALRIVSVPNNSLIARYRGSISAFSERLASDDATVYMAKRGPAVGGTDRDGESDVDSKRNDAQRAVARAGVPRGSRAGGPFKHGTYEFEMPLPSINQVNRYRIHCYENGEWRQEANEAWNKKTDKFTYDQRSGALDVDVLLNLYNSTYDDSDFCRF